jgi:Flp pilus assembly protein protease CpaA
VTLTLILLLGYISVVDFLSHRIPNRALVLLAIISFLRPEFRFLNWWNQLSFSLTILLTLLIFYLIFNLGMGDVKMMMVLSLTVIPAELSLYRNFLCGFLTASSIHTLWQLNRGLRKNPYIPLAPSISIATIVVLTTN